MYKTFQQHVSFFFKLRQFQICFGPLNILRLFSIFFRGYDAVVSASLPFSLKIADIVLLITAVFFIAPLFDLLNSSLYFSLTRAMFAIPNVFVLEAVLFIVAFPSPQALSFWSLTRDFAVMRCSLLPVEIQKIIQELVLSRQSVVYGGPQIS